MRMSYRGENGMIYTETHEEMKERIRQESQDQREQAQRELQETAHAQALARITLQHELKKEERASKLATELDLQRLKFAQEPELRELNYQDLLRESNVTLQKLKVELALRDQIAQNEHDRNVDFVYQSTMMEITKETARILDEKNKALALIEAENKAAQYMEALKHRHTLEKSHQEHLQATDAKNQNHHHELERDVLQSRLHQENFTHEEVTRLAVRVLARELGLEEHQINEAQINEWIEGFEREF